MESLVLSHTLFKAISDDGGDYGWEPIEFAEEERREVISGRWRWS
ncbi:MAG: hypothetical protein OXC72_11970 [Roseovarius sp.]|nr:hypothetical protein [Roseovarius sp.]